MSPRRWILAGAGLAVAATVIVWWGATITGWDPLRGTTCLGQPFCPGTLIPARGFDPATVTVKVANADPGWIEGGFFYMQVAEEDGQIVLSQQLEYEPTPPGPSSGAPSGVQPPSPKASGEAYLPAGSYELTVYARSCDGNCNFLDGPSLICTYPITVDTNDHVTIEYDWRDCEGAHPSPSTS